MSLTIQGLLVLLLSTIVRSFELDFDEGQVTEIATSITLVVGFIGAWLGRIRLGDINIFGKRV